MISIDRSNDRDRTAILELSKRLALPFTDTLDSERVALVLAYRAGRLSLCDRREQRSRPVFARIDDVLARYSSLPASRRGILARAIGKKTRSVVDATAGLGADLGLLVAMGFRVTAVERSSIVAALLEDGLMRLRCRTNVRGRYHMPRLVIADAIHFLADAVNRPECVYLDPMFPPKRKRSALAKRPLRILRDVVGDDVDRQQLFTSALNTASRRVVVKRPNDARPLGGGIDESYVGKLVRYDVYLTGRGRD